MKNYKVVAIVDFTFGRISEVEFTKKEKRNENWIYKGDEFLCDKETYEYLSGNNAKKLNTINLIEIFKKQETETKEKIVEEKPIKKTNNKKKSK